ncbi:MAG TPA: hypothetical protein VKB57_23610 [Acidimicrobiales bacterium]|nr:hypothetical protein [Acidimicrobiales bacterium]
MAEPLRPMAVPTVPTEVTLTRDDLIAPRFTPRELREIKQTFERPFGAIIAEEDTDDKFVVLAWVKLRRDYPDLTLDQIDDVVITVRPGEATPVDPSSADTSMS